ncbi:MAG TPA: hypothetical protein VFG66_17995 [Gemmatimonadales bacterium]|nr:hypothetical protein [Gemmatimonadales bacterium]
MTRDSPLALAIGVLALLPVVLWASRFYAVPDPWDRYDTAVRAYLAAGARGDSTELGRHAASAQPVAWVRQTARRRPDLVTAWSRELRGLTGERRGDTVAVVLSAPELQGCSQTSSVSALFLNHSASPRLLAIGSACVDRQALRVLRTRPVAHRLLTGSR